MLFGGDFYLSNTIYDSVYRTLLNDCTSLIIPVINEVFGTHYSGDEDIHLYPNENILTSPEGELYTRITDSNFVIIEGSPQRYHIECESSENDSTMLIRMYEYDSQIALSDVQIEGSTLRAKLPRSAILYLRHNRHTPDEYKMIYEADGMQLVRRIPTLKVQRYSLDEIFQKELYYFLPFHIFVHEKELSLYNKDANKRQILLDEYKLICQKLNQLWREEKINELTVDCIVNGMKQVLEKIAVKYSNVIKDGEKVMGGEILDYPAKTARREGLAEGLAEGRSEGIEETLAQLVKDGVLSPEEAARRGQQMKDALLH